MEFQAYNVLVIASDIRQLEQNTHLHQILFTKVLDMHPLLRILNMQNTYAVLEIGCKAISSHKDYEMYEAIRLLSIVKSRGYATSYD
jgi:phenylalanine-4-hydroxylase